MSFHDFIEDTKTEAREGGMGLAFLIAVVFVLWGAAAVLVIVALAFTPRLGQIGVALVAFCIWRIAKWLRKPA